MKRTCFDKGAKREDIGAKFSNISHERRVDSSQKRSFNNSNKTSKAIHVFIVNEDAS
jgi:hypothetical protein